jgi:hypothetical protein
MTDRIEMFHTLDVDGRPIFRAKGVVRYTPTQLAEALGVDESLFDLKLDPVVLAAEEKRKRRHRPGQTQRFKSADEAFWDDYHGHGSFDPITGR